MTQDARQENRVLSLHKTPGRRSHPASSCILPPQGAREPFRRVKHRPDQSASTAQILKSTSPWSSPAARTSRSDTSAASGDVFLAHTIQSLSVVTRPAYPEAQIEARNWTPGEALISAVPAHMKRWRL